MKHMLSAGWKRFFGRNAAPMPTFGVGAAKTGTSSLAALLERSGVAAAHEPDCEQLIGLILARESGRLDVVEFRKSVKTIIEQQALAANISQINGFIIDDLFAIFPRARYILTVRDAESWVLSLLNHVTSRPLEKDNVWHQFRALRFERNLPHRPNDERLKHAGLQSLDSYLTYWLEHTMKVLSRVPSDQLLIVPTSQINQNLESIASFINFGGALVVGGTHENRGSYTKPALIDTTYLRQRCAAFTRLFLRRAKSRVDPQQLQRLTEIVKPPRTSYYARPSDERIAQTKSLILDRATDLRRWEEVDAETDERWDGRARLAASMIADQKSVADLGCGAMLVEKYLDAGVRYVPIDVVRRDARTIVWDLNAASGKLPAKVEASCVVVLGLLEYMHDIPCILASLALKFGCVVCSYLPTDTSPSVEQRRATGWVNDFSVEEMENAFATARLVIERKEIYRDHTYLWRLSGPSAADPHH